MLRSSETILSAYQIFNREGQRDIPETRVALLKLIMYLTKIAIRLEYTQDTLERAKKEKT